MRIGAAVFSPAAAIVLEAVSHQRANFQTGKVSFRLGKLLGPLHWTTSAN
jgi:hypothetical protein